MSDNVDFGDFNWLSGGTPSVEDFDWTDYFSQQNATPLPAGDSSEFLNTLPGYYDETSGKWVIDFASGTTPGDIAAGPNERWKDWKYDASKQTWTDPLGKNYDLSYLKSGKGAWDLIKSFGSKAADAATSKTGMAGILALLSYLDRQKGTTSGGGTAQAYAGPSKPLTPSTVQGKYGPLVTYAANGGLMQAYANGGKVQMEDGGFVMTKKAVDGAGGPRGIQQLVPGARMIGGPPDPTGRRDLTPAVIHGPNGQTPAKVSSGEAYIPKAAVDDQGGADKMYALMNSLQRSA
jgi:hypothetical protein